MWIEATVTRCTEPCVCGGLAVRALRRGLGVNSRRSARHAASPAKEIDDLRETLLKGTDFQPERSSLIGNNADTYSEERT